MFKLDGNTVVFQKSKKLSKRHKFILSRIKDEETRQAYIASLLGIGKGKLILDRGESNGINDILAEKPREATLRIMRRMMDCSASRQHEPLIRKDGSRWIGVEIECIIPGQSNHCDYCDGWGTESCSNCDGSGKVTLTDEEGNEYLNECAECGGDGYIECRECDGNASGDENIHEEIREKLRAEKITKCSVRPDGSVQDDSGDYVGAEITVLFDAAHGFEKLEKVCKILAKMGAKVNETCGLHVHFDQKGKTEAQVMRVGHRLGRFLPILAKFVPEERRANNFCELCVSSLDGNRYSAINLTSFRKHETIEVRLHSGTTSAEKIINWIKLLQKIMNKGSLSGKAVSEFSEMCEKLKLNKKLTAYFKRRFEKFNPDETTTDEDAGANSPEAIADACQTMLRGA